MITSLLWRFWPVSQEAWMPLWLLDRLLVWPSWIRLGDRGVHACMCIRAVNTTLQWDMTYYSLCFTTRISAKPGMASASLPKRANVGRLLLMVVALHSCRGDREGKCFTDEDTVQRQKCTQTTKFSVMHNFPEQDLFQRSVLFIT